MNHRRIEIVSGVAIAMLPNMRPLLFQRRLILAAIVFATAVEWAQPSGAAAGTVVIRFNALEASGTTATSLGSTYQEQGFTFSVPSGPGSALRAFQSGSTNYAGSAALSSVYLPTVTLVRDHGALFDLVEINIAETSPDALPATRTILFSGTKQDNSIVNTNVTLDSVWGFQAFPLPGFTGLTKLEWVGEDNGLYQVDNITLNIVPEPSTGILLATIVPILWWRFALASR